MIDSPRKLSGTKGSGDYRSHPFTLDSPVCSPVRRSEPGSASSRVGRDSHSPAIRSPHDVSDYSIHNGSVSISVDTTASNSLSKPDLLFFKPNFNFFHYLSITHHIAFDLACFYLR